MLCVLVSGFPALYYNLLYRNEILCMYCESGPIEGKELDLAAPESQ